MIIDRFEGEYAVIEQDIGKFINVNKDNLPINAKEGDVLIYENGIYKIDISEKEKIKEEVLKLQNSLWK